MNYFSTGEVSKRLNLSLRTLRYYDQIGLVEPSWKDENGKRFYTVENMLLLEKILLLKSTSLSLKDIEKVIFHASIESVLIVHRKNLDFQVNQLN